MKNVFFWVWNFSASLALQQTQFTSNLFRKPTQNALFWNFHCFCFISSINDKFGVENTLDGATITFLHEPETICLGNRFFRI